MILYHFKLTVSWLNKFMNVYVIYVYCIFLTKGGLPASYGSLPEGGDDFFSPATKRSLQGNQLSRPCYSMFLNR